MITTIRISSNGEGRWLCKVNKNIVVRDDITFFQVLAKPHEAEYELNCVDTREFNEPTFKRLPERAVVEDAFLALWEHTEPGKTISGVDFDKVLPIFERMHAYCTGEQVYSGEQEG